MNEPQEIQEQTADDGAAAHLTVEDVEEQVREAEALHQSLTEKLSATAKE